MFEDEGCFEAHEITRSVVSSQEEEELINLERETEKPLKRNVVAGFVAAGAIIVLAGASLVGFSRLVYEKAEAPSVCQQMKLAQSCLDRKPVSQSVRPKNKGRDQSLLPQQKR
jgi:hypothetical protein